MALRFLIDENLRGRLWSAIQRHNARGQHEVDAVRVGDGDALPLGAPDPDILVWAEQQDRILVTSDRSTMEAHLRSHLAAGHHSPGVFSLPQMGSVREVVEFLALSAYASDPLEWRDRIEYF